MKTSPLLFALGGFLIGGLIVSAALTFFNPPQSSNSMMNMSSALEGKSGEEFDKAFLSGMIVHHQDAVKMANMAEMNAGRQEIKDLSQEIKSAQEKEISQMQMWQMDWGYTSMNDSTHSMGH